MKAVRFVMACLMGLALWGCSEQQSSEPQVVKLAVSESGFTPLEIAARKGTPLTLLVTRESEASCAKEIIIPGANIRRSLPVRQEVSITFTPTKRGSMQYTCCDDMTGGKIVVR